MFNFEPVLAAFKLKPLFLTGSVLELETDWTVRYNSKRFSHHLEVFMSDLNPNEFYFGFSYDLASGSADMTKRVFYDPSDLTTHAVITGMTGSGKTGMGIILLEEQRCRYPRDPHRSQRRPNKPPAALPQPAARRLQALGGRGSRPPGGENGRPGSR